ncbi:MAG: N-acetyltransferase [Candidatus Micrarchaeia archaeon]|jgi:amino-acid N-acetyltransferase
MEGTVESAKLADAPEIKKLLDYYAKRERLLPRALIEICESIRDFKVFRKGGKTIGCCALNVCWTDLGEIRSLAVGPRHAKRGIGSLLLQACLKDAKSLGLKRVFTLTYVPEFFTKNGFKKIKREKLPHKIWGDCVHCTKFPECDETAMETALK